MTRASQACNPGSIPGSRTFYYPILICQILHGL
jgi:hypothetical protein